MPNLYYRISDPSDVRDLGDQMAVWVAAGNPKADAWAEQPASPSPDAVWQDGAWSVPPVPTFTAEQWIDSQGYTAIRLISLLDAEAKLIATNKTSVKMTAVRSWLDSILGQFAINPTPQADWVSAPYGYEETIQEAITTLTANPET